MITSSQEYCYRTLKLLQKTPELTQRQIATKLGVSLGKGHYVVKALIDVGFLKLDTPPQGGKNMRFIYALTAKGVREKARLAKRSLKYKQEEYKKLQREIKLLKVEVNGKKKAVSLK